MTCFFNSFSLSFSQPFQKYHQVVKNAPFLSHMTTEITRPVQQLGPTGFGALWKAYMKRENGNTVLALVVEGVEVNIVGVCACPLNRYWKSTRVGAACEGLERALILPLPTYQLGKWSFWLLPVFLLVENGGGALLGIPQEGYVGNLGIIGPAWTKSHMGQGLWGGGELNET